MKLQEFVSETLKAIVVGVTEAQQHVATVGARINPEQEWDDKGETRHVLGANRMIPVKEVDFDVAVTSTDATQVQAGAGIFVATLVVGAKGKSDTSSSSISRIKFSIPIVLPVQEKK